jgi:hypothetical protein
MADYGHDLEFGYFLVDSLALLGVVLAPEVRERVAAARAQASSEPAVATS